MGVDESRSDHEAFVVDGFLAFDFIFSDDRDAAVLDPDVPHGVEVGLGIHDATIQDHDVEVVRDRGLGFGGRVVGRGGGLLLLCGRRLARGHRTDPEHAEGNP